MVINGLKMYSFPPVFSSSANAWLLFLDKHDSLLRGELLKQMRSLVFNRMK